jgi:hypothetical protein
MQKSPSPQTEYMDVDSPWSYLRTGVPADTFRALRAKVIAAAGFDFLAKCADMIRSKTFKSNKPGVAKKSRHQCGDAFDYNIESPFVVAVQEDVGGHTQFRSYLKAASQDGSLGKLRTLTHYNGKKVKAYFVDFTELAGAFGWHRIPAHKGWATKGPNFGKMEYWHYQNTEGKSWDEAMTILYPKK